MHGISMPETNPEQPKSVDRARRPGTESAESGRFKAETAAFCPLDERGAARRRAWYD